MYLEANGRRIEVAGVLARRCTLRKPTTLDPCEADFVTIIDGTEYRKRVSFPNGISGESLARISHQLSTAPRNGTQSLVVLAHQSSTY